MLVAILVIGYVLFLRYLDHKQRQKERSKLGPAVSVGPVDFDSLKGELADLSARLTGLESTYKELSERLGGLR